MKKIFLSLSLALAAIFGGQQAQAQFKLGKTEPRRVCRP